MQIVNSKIKRTFFKGLCLELVYQLLDFDYQPRHQSEFLIEVHLLQELFYKVEVVRLSFRVEAWIL
jgi:hypothetical protein